MAKEKKMEKWKYEGKREKRSIPEISIHGNVYSHIIAHKMFLCGTKNNFLNFAVWKMLQKNGHWYKTSIQSLSFP